MLLQTKNVSYEIQWKWLIQDLSFVIDKNQVVSIIWYNGSWKSTLLKLLLGTIHPTSGTITRSPWIRIWYVPQKLSFINELPLTVDDFITIYNGEKNQNIPMSCSQFDIEHLRQKPLNVLSGGQLQKVLIYNALIGSPEVLFLDEPTSWLDVVAQKEFYNLIDHINQEHEVSIVLVSHDIHTVYKKSDKVICIHKGKCCSGSPTSEEFSNEVKSLLWGYVVPYLHKHEHSHDW